MTTHDVWVFRPQAEGLVVDLARLADGRVTCRLCLRFTHPDDLFRDGVGRQWDVCAPCAWKHSGLPSSICHCRCCIELAYWQQNGRPKYVLADTCRCDSYVDRAMACTCAPCLAHAPRGQK